MLAMRSTNTKALPKAKLKIACTFKYINIKYSQAPANAQVAYGSESINNADDTAKGCTHHTIHRGDKVRHSCVQRDRSAGDGE